MLQWMGGSRRKVAASHTSVKKRQKQYFEQRRQQQNQFTVGSESCLIDRNDSNHHQREHQSLDILNLVNLSTPTPVCKPSCQKGGTEDLDANFYSPKDNISGVGKVSTLSIYESGDDAGSSLNPKAEPTSSKRTSFTLPENQKNDIKKANTTSNLIDGTERKLSVFDLVGDDHTTTNLEECSPSEPHMAFSVEGLGKMNTETPPNSPHPSGRTFEYRRSSPWTNTGQPSPWTNTGQPSPWKNTGQPYTSSVRERINDFEEVDTMFETSKMFQDDSRYRSPVGTPVKDGGRKEKMCAFSDHLHKPYISDSGSYFCDTADFSNSRVFDENAWNDKSAFLVEEEDSSYWKGQQPFQNESMNLNFMDYGKGYTETLSSAEHHRTKRRDYLETPWRSNIEEIPFRGPQCLERTMDHPSFAKAVYSKFPEKFDFDQPVWSSIVPEEDKDSHSLRSEESCSSSAVWANENPVSQFKTTTRQRKGDTDSFHNLEDKSYLNNDIFQQSWQKWDANDQHLKRKVGSRKHVRLSKTGKLKSTSQRDSSFRGGLDAPNGWFAEGVTSAGIRSDITTDRDKPYPFLDPEPSTSHCRQFSSPDSIPETWAPMFSVGRGTGDDNDNDNDNEHDYANCLSANHKSKLAGDISGFETDTLSENDNEKSRDVNHPKNQGDETSSSIAKSLSDENECKPNKEVNEARHQGNRGSGEKTSRRDSFQHMIMLEKRTLQLVCFNKSLLPDSFKT